MGFDGKYGKVTTEHGSIPDDEPVIVFRARDQLLPQVLAYYQAACMEAGSPDRHLNLIRDAGRTVKAWQQKNGMKIPDSERSKAWMAE